MNPRAELQTIRERHEFAEGLVINGESPRTGQTHKDRARLLDAVEKVLELHQEIPFENRPSLGYCRACYHGGMVGFYPCLTVQAITTALKEQL